MWGNSGGWGLVVCVCVGGQGLHKVIDVLVHNAYVEIRGQPVLKCLLETSFNGLELGVGPATLSVSVQDPPVSMSIPTGIVQKAAPVNFSYEPLGIQTHVLRLARKALHRPASPQSSICFFIPFGCLLPSGFIS